MEGWAERGVNYEKENLFYLDYERTCTSRLSRLSGRDYIVMS